MDRRDANYYEAHAQTINLDTITSNEQNATILQRLRDNDPTFGFLQITDDNDYIDENIFIIDEGDDLGWLGYFVGNNTTLRELSMGDLTFSNISKRFGAFIQYLSRNRSIETLVIGVDLGRIGFRQMGDFLRNNNNMRELFFSSLETVGIESARSIAFMLSQGRHSNLRNISFVESGASEEVLAEIATGISTHSQLEELNLGENNLGRQGSVILGNALKACNNPRLQRLVLWSISVDDEGLRFLVEGMRNCHNLTELDLAYNESITADGFWSLSTLFQSEHCHLKHLDLTSMNIEDDGARAIAQGLASLNLLEELHISHNSIGDDGARALGAGLANLRSLEKLYLGNNSIGDVGLQSLVEGLINCDNVKELGLSGNRSITAAGMGSLSTLLQSERCSLTDILLGEIPFGDDGAPALADGLKDNRSMEHFYLSNNSISDRGLQALVEGLVNCDDLKVLSLSGNRMITASGLRSLSTLLQFESCALTEITLWGIPFGDDGAVVLADALKGNTSMKQLSFGPDSARVTTVGWKAFSELLCDTSNVNTTYLSNHSLERIGKLDNGSAPSDVKALLALSNHPAEHVAIHKILKSHSDFDIEPFFEWKMKLLPRVVSWFEKVRTLMNVYDHSWISDESAEEIQSRQLSAMYNFVRGMPLLAIGGYRSRNNAALLAPSRKRKIEQLCK